GAGERSCLARLEAPHCASRRTEVQCRQCVDLARMCDRRDRTENSLRFLYAGTVIGFDAPQVLLDDATRGDLLLTDGILDAVDRRFLNLKPRRAPLSRLRHTCAEACTDHNQEGCQVHNSTFHTRGA